MNLRTLLFIGISISVIILILFLFLIFSFGRFGPAKVTPEISPQTTGVVNQSKFGFQLVTSTPANQAINVPLQTQISALFNKDITSPTVTVSPSTSFTSIPSGRNLVIKLNNPLLPSTRYIVTIQIEDQSFFITFTSAGPTPTLGQNTRPIDQVDKENADLKVSRPDVYLSNYTPFSNSSFSIMSSFVSGNPGHFQFTVSSKNGKNATIPFQSWAQQQGLNSTQISSLDVVYK